MYSYEQRKKAVELYIQFGFALRAVIRELGYPTSEQSIRNWYKEYKENGELHQELDSPFKYTPEQKAFAVQHYLQHGKCLSRTVKMLGYPCRQLLREWVMEVAPDTLFCISVLQKTRLMLHLRNYIRQPVDGSASLVYYPCVPPVCWIISVQ